VGALAPPTGGGVVGKGEEAADEDMDSSPVEDPGADNPGVLSNSADSSSIAIILVRSFFFVFDTPVEGVVVEGVVVEVELVELVEVVETANNLELLVLFAALSEDVADDPDDSSNDRFGEREMRRLRVSVFAGGNGSGCGRGREGAWVRNGVGGDMSALNTAIGAGRGVEDVGDGEREVGSGI
jgi:hypothetical protein